MEGLGFRIGVDLTQIISGIKSKACLYVDLTCDNTIQDLEQRIRNLFRIECDIALTTDSYFLPSTESVRILRDGDVIRVFYSTIGDSGQEHESKTGQLTSPTTSSCKNIKLVHKNKKRQYILNDIEQEDENNECNNKEENVTPITSSYGDIPARHKTKSDRHVLNGAQLIESECKETKSNKRDATIAISGRDKNKVSKNKKRKRSKLDCATSGIQDVCDESAVTSLKKLYSKCLALPTSEQTDTIDEANQIESSLNNYKQKHNLLVGNTTVDIDSNDLNVKSKKPRKRRKRTHKKKSQELNLTEQLHTSQNLCQYSKQYICEPPQTKHTRFSLDDPVAAAADGASSCPVYEDTCVNLQETNSDNLDSKLQSTQLSIISNVTEIKSKWDERTFENSSVNAVIKNNTSPKLPVNDVIEKVFCPGQYQCTPLVFEGKKTELNTHIRDISDNKCTAKESTNKSLDLSTFMPDAYPKLSGTPRKKDLLAFKMLKLGADYSPQLSGFIIARVESFSLQTSEVNLQILDGLDELEEPKGKFHLADDEEDNTDVNKINIMKLNWNEMLESRLLYP